MQSAVAQISPPERRLTLELVVNDLVADGLAAKEVAEKLLRDRRHARGDVHPLVTVAEQKWKDPRNPKKLLHIETLTEWLADRAKLPYLHIDPFKIEFATVTKVMSNAYATRFKILPVEVTPREVVIATCEPYVREWEPQLQQILRKEIKRVIANPLDINSYIVEFYNLSCSVKAASETDQGAYSQIANFEQ
ncbi:MAG: type II/IV secretion system protein, partial [Betaproteobacteria bacterium]